MGGQDTHLGCVSGRQWVIFDDRWRSEEIAVVVGFDGGVGFQQWGVLAFVSAGDMAVMPCPLDAQRGTRGVQADVLTWVV
jgi:hypothetical protein